MKNRLLALLALVLLCAPGLRADEGMWLLPMLEKFNSADMIKSGCKLTPEQIYSINNSSLKDAIVQFGRGCTGEIVSAEGLLLTNHHCGYESIQALSSVEHDYLKDGFWAMTRDQELPVEGLTVRFIKKFVDVTAQLEEINAKNISDKAKAKAIERLKDKMVKQEEKADPYVTCDFVEMYGGNQTFLIVSKIYKDVRLAGTPPSSIGKFGGDTDNWMWPRHTGDFSMFRVYADKNNNPAEYSEDNVPYRADRHLTISLDGVKEGDFTMIIGFPGRTNRYITSSELVEKRDIENAIRAEVRGIRQEILMKDMLADPKVYIQYASKYAVSSNYWKNSIGMNEAFEKLDVEGRCIKAENAFVEWLNGDPDRVARYGTALEQADRIVKSRVEERTRGMYSSEALGSIELLKWAGSFADRPFSEIKDAEADLFYRDFALDTDRKVAKRMLELFLEKVPEAAGEYIYGYINENYGGDMAAFVDDVYGNTVFASYDSFKEAVENSDEQSYRDLLQTDKAAVAGKILSDQLKKYASEMKKGDKELAAAKKAYIGGLLEMKEGQPVYPDANLTMRLTYGKVLPYSPKDAVMYDYITTLKGVMEKENPENPEFEVPAKLKELYEKGDFGRYAMPDGRMPVAFLSNNDITGGNSGSPIMNAEGELIGLAFDGNYEAISGDVIFEPQLQRCINVDIRYVLFIIDKFGGAGHFVDEMTIKD